MDLVPHAEADKAARQEWASLHPGIAWPMDWKPAMQGGWPSPAPSAALAAEADELFVRAVQRHLRGGIEDFAQLVQEKTSLVENLVGRPDNAWRGDWSQWRTQQWQSVAYDEAATFREADLVSREKWLPPPTGLPVTRQTLAFAALNRTSSNPFYGSQGVNWDNVAGVSELMKRFRSVLPPRVMLSNMISFRDGLVREGGSKSLIRDLNRQIGIMSMEIRRYFGPDEGY